MMDVNRNPSRRELRVFALLLPLPFAILGAARWRAGAAGAAEAIWSVGFVLTLVAWALRSTRRWIYLAWMYATYPVAWVVSHAVLAAAYFLVMTPVALVLRAAGRDPMQRRLDRGATSYWVARPRTSDTARYFRQF
jgi:hypothetical protein